MVSYKHMEYFIEVANAKQISKASSNLNVSQSTITMAMKTIEDRIGAKLFVRNQKGIELTYKGYLFLEHAKRIVLSIGEMMSISNQDSFLTKGKITIALSFTISGYYFANYYSEFIKSFPNIKVTLIETNRVNIEKGLVSGKYDIGLFNIVRLENKDKLIYQTIFNSIRNLWVSGNHKFAKKNKISLNEIVKEPSAMIMVDEAGEIANKYWNKYRLTPNIIYKTESIEAIRSIVANGDAVSILSDLVYRPWSLEGKKIEKVSIIENIPPLDVGIVVAKKNHRTNAQDLFLKFMKVSL